MRASFDIASNLIPDDGAEGRVLDAFRKKITPDKILTVSIQTVANYFDTAFEKIPEIDHRKISAISIQVSLQKVSHEFANRKSNHGVPRKKTLP